MLDKIENTTLVVFKYDGVLKNPIHCNVLMTPTCLSNSYGKNFDQIMGTLTHIELAFYRIADQFIESEAPTCDAGSFTLFGDHY